MEGTTIPYLKNHLRDNRSLGQRVELGAAVKALLDSEGWDALSEMAVVMVQRQRAQLRQNAEKVALSADLQPRIDFARQKGVHEGTELGMAIFRDIARSIVESAETAARELRADAETASAGGK